MINCRTAVGLHIQTDKRMGFHSIQCTEQVKISKYFTYHLVLDTALFHLLALRPSTPVLPRSSQKQHYPSTLSHQAGKVQAVDGPRPKLSGSLLIAEQDQRNLCYMAYCPNHQSRDSRRRVPQTLLYLPIARQMLQGLYLW